MNVGFTNGGGERRFIHSQWKRSLQRGKRACIYRYRCDDGSVLRFVTFAAPQGAKMPPEFFSRFGTFQLCRKRCGKIEDLKRELLWRTVPLWVLHELDHPVRALARHVESFPEMGDLKDA